jgi:uncharacterized protein (DUF433 family)
VPETLHIGAYLCVSTAESVDRVTRKSPANRRVLVLHSPDGWPDCHAEGRGFESLQPLSMIDGRITVDPNRMRGLPCIRDTRVTVSAVLGQLAAGASIDDLLADYPYLEREDVLAALEYAAAAAQERELAVVAPAA